MPPLRAFAALGLLVREQFLAPDECRALAAHMLQARGDAAAVFGDRSGGQVDAEVRRAAEVNPPAQIAMVIDARLHALRVDLEAHFNTSLREPDAPAYLVYREGSFYRPHRDRRQTPDDTFAHLRAVSVVIFINGSDEAGTYTGGRLRFYGLLGDDGLAEIGLDGEPASGALIAFPSTMLHEVTAVTGGVRCSAVTWFLDAR